jgi:hypothetical protein
MDKYLRYKTPPFGLRLGIRCPLTDGGKAHCGDPASWMPRVGFGGSPNLAIKTAFNEAASVAPDGSSLG